MFWNRLARRRSFPGGWLWAAARRKGICVSACKAELGNWISRSLYTLTEADELNLTIEQEADWIQQHLDHPSKIIFVAEYEGRLIGILDFACGHRRRIAHHGEFGMSVEKEWREQGIGAALTSSITGVSLFLASTSFGFCFSIRHTPYFVAAFIATNGVLLLSGRCTKL